MASFSTSLCERFHSALVDVPLVDCHEHLQPEAELARIDTIHLGRFFVHYASCDLITAGMPAADMAKVQGDATLSPTERWQLFKPWYQRAWNTGYCEALRIAIRDIYGFEDFADDTVEPLTEAMRAQVKPGFTRKVFAKAGIEVAMNHPLGGQLIFSPDFDSEDFICDMVDGFTALPIAELARQRDCEILSLADYLQMIDSYFEEFAPLAGAFKVGRAYDRTLLWRNVSRDDAEPVFNRLLAGDDKPERREIQALEDFILHYLCRKCGEYHLRMKFHTGLQEGNGNIIRNSRAALMANLFMKYPQTNFDIYHISYPYQDELVTLAKNFPNVTINFCWMWVISPAAGRRALSEMLDAVPASKIHGFGGDYIFVEGSYAHAMMARREIARVLCEKVEEGRFSEEYALTVGRMLLRDNAMANFGLAGRRRAFREWKAGR